MLYANYVRNKMRHLYKPIIAEAEGVPCVLEYSKGKYMKDYEIYGNSVQDGTPSPENPVEIQSVGDLVIDETSEYYGKYDIPITVAGKNLFDMETILPEQGWVKQDDGSYYVENASTPFKKVLWENVEGYTGQLKILFTFKYLKSTVDNAPGVTIRVVYTDNTYITVQFINAVEADTWYISNYNTITNSSKTVQKIEWSYGTGLNSTWVKDIIITKDITATEYEPYHEPITTHIYLDEPLRKVGDYSDYVDFKKQKVVRNVKEITFNGTENWVYQESNNIIYLSINNLASSVYCYSTHFLSTALKDTNSPFFRPVTDVLRLYQQNGNILYSSADEFKIFLANQNTAGTPLIVDYILTTPIEENVSLPTLQTFKGTTIMSVDTTVLPSNIKVTYIRT